MWKTLLLTKQQKNAPSRKPQVCLLRTCVFIYKSAPQYRWRHCDTKRVTRVSSEEHAFKGRAECKEGVEQTQHVRS